MTHPDIVEQHRIATEAVRASKMRALKLLPLNTLLLVFRTSQDDLQRIANSPHTQDWELEFHAHHLQSVREAILHRIRVEQDN